MTPKNFRLTLVARSDDEELPMEPESLEHWPQHWRYLGQTFRVDCAEHLPAEEIALRIKHHVLKNSDLLSKMRKEIEAFENFSRAPSARRERIPESVRMFVWQRDQGRCVHCEGRQNLEFDHIIPVVEGGANTERNIQLLCESCNRSKGRKV